MAKTFPVKVTWHDSDGKARSKGFNLIPLAQRFGLRLSEQDLRYQIWAQGELFESDEKGSAKAYDPRYEIPY